MIKAGLTGGLATGKTTVTAMFAELGAPAINADDIVRRLLAEDKKVIEEVTNRLGPQILTPGGAIDRVKVADMVFPDEKKMSSLTSVLYPVVRQEITNWFDEKESENKHRAAIAEVSMLIEGGALWLYDRIIVVLAGREDQLRRSMLSGISNEDFERRIKNQMPIEEKVRFADYIIDNSGSLEHTKEQVLEVWDKLAEIKKSKH